MKSRFEKRVSLLIIMVFLLSVSMTGCGSKVQKQTATGTAMGTVINQTIYTNEDELTGQVMNLLNGLESDTLSWRIADSEIGQINANAGTEKESTLSKELEQDFNLLKQVAIDSNGAFDYTVGPLVQLWNIDEWAVNTEKEAIIPTDSQIQEVLTQVGYERITIKDGTILLPKGMNVDLGAVGKGIACDRIAEYLKKEKVTGAVISVGGSIVTLGQKTEGGPWQVGIVNPRDTTHLLGTLSLEGEWYVSTSGDYERYVEVDGIRYHHILDPATGYPANSGVCSVTILGDSGALCDALSTACFVLGVEEGMQLAQKYEAEALFVDTNGKQYMTEGMQSYFTEQ